MLVPTLILLQAANPYLLNIGTPGKVTIRPGSLVRTTDGNRASTGDIAELAAKRGLLFLGEQHATPAHQEMHARLVKAVSEVAENSIVGVEMLTRPTQPALDRFIELRTSESEFLTECDWKTTWGYDYAFYRPLFEVCRQQSLPMVALNVPRTWVRSVGRLGFNGLSPVEKAELPADMHLGNRQHREVFDALMGGHTMPGGNDTMYSAQVLWDEGMADTMIKALSSRRSSTVGVVIAGAGHVMFGQGINYRMARRLGKRGVNVVMLSSDKPIEVSKGIADFVYVTRPEPGQQR
jgi:uncharacterized iron-regulated protein